jgi:polyhydroxybutyrate depolymerase
MRRTFPVLVLLLAAANLAAADNPPRKEWTVEGVTREALVYVPASAKAVPCPVVLAFHGHGGTMQNAAKKFAYHKLWPEAIVVYMQGLNTPGVLTGPEGKMPGGHQLPDDVPPLIVKFFRQQVRP